jgi:hypothetical protein
MDPVFPGGKNFLVSIFVSSALSIINNHFSWILASHSLLFLAFSLRSGLLSRSPISAMLAKERALDSRLLASIQNTPQNLLKLS